MLLTRAPLLSFLLLLTPAVQSFGAPAREIRYTGTLSQAGRADEDLTLRRFEVLVLTSADGTGFFSLLEEDDQNGCPWPESYGNLSGAGSIMPHLMYVYDGLVYNLHLPPLILQMPSPTEEGVTWNADGWTFEAIEKSGNAAQATWSIEGSERRGRKQSLVVDAATGTLRSANQDVFMGQGERFKLTLKQSSSTAIDESAAEQLQKVQDALISLQARMQRRSDSQQLELSARQIHDASEALPGLTGLSRDTLLQEAVLRIHRDVTRQERRVAETMKRRDQLHNTAAPAFNLQLMDGGQLKSSELKGKTVILHFWSYTDKPLSEPYGQVGYLEFLSSRRKQANVSVVGIATNPALLKEDQSRTAIRGARKLAEFMNLTYPIGYDDGSLLKTLGDPRENGGELPLWVVISPEGNVIHYHSGYYEIDRRQGLKELDDIITP
ncbi:MAG: TlpA disulfide reductase family protein [Planctomycetaceae bacterium]